MAKPDQGPRDDGWPGDAGRKADRLRAWRARRRQFGLRHIMAGSVVVGLVFAAIARAERTGAPSDQLLAIFAVAAALTVAGLTIALRSERWDLLGWILSVVAAPIGGAIGIFLSGEGEVPIVLGLLLMVVLIGTLVHLARRLRAAHQESMLWTLALAADRGRPLGPAVAALAEQSVGRNRARLRHVVECLDSGLTLPEALDFVRRSAPAPARLLVRVGHDSGMLAEALHDAASGRSSRPTGWQSFGARFGYLCLVLVIVQAIIGFILYFVLPKFQVIFKDFGMSLPPVTNAMFEMSRWLTDGVILPIATLVEWLILLYLPFAFTGYGEMKIPIIDRLFLRRHSILILRCLAMVVEGGRPIGPALKTMAVAYPARWVGDRIGGAYLAIERGHDWLESLWRYRLIARTDAALLESARRSGNLPWALRELADAGGRRLQYRLQVIGQVLFSVALLILGGFVGFVAMAYFFPLVQLIESLAR
jgi:type II secretory pathway component PulF